MGSLHDACKAGDAAKVRSLLQASGGWFSRGTDKNKSDMIGRTPLYLAAFFGHDTCVDLLLKAGADKNKANKITKADIE